MAAVRGIHTLQLGGYLGADPVNVPVDMDEVEDPRPFQFPEQSASALELQTRLAGAESAARWAQALGVVAPSVSGLSLLALALGLALALLLAQRSIAQAHAFIVSASPGPNGFFTSDQPPTQVQITFSQEVISAFSTISLPDSF